MYTYKIKFSIFGKQMSAQVRASDSAEAFQKFLIGIFKRLDINDVIISQNDGSEVDPDEYLRHANDMMKQMIEMKEKNRMPFSMN